MSRAGIAWALVSLSLAAAWSRTARAEVDQDFAIWSAVLSTVRVGDGPTGPVFWLDTHARRGDAGTVGIVRPGLGWQLTPALSGHIGYAWIPTASDTADSRFDEHRVWQQVVAAASPRPGLSLQSRTRFEQRLGEGSSELGYRVRQFVRAGFVPEGSPVGPVVWDELFVGLNDVDWGPRRGYDQNRLFVGGAAPIGGWARLEIGYLLVHLDRDTDQLVHAWALNLFLTI